MSSLEPDTKLVFPHVQRLAASAGSGKTHALTHRYLQFLLSEGIPRSDLSQLLAVTFTNKAAFEMKDRIVTWLKALCCGDPRITEAVRESLGTSGPDLAARARLKLDELFDNYLDFSVRTIDSFLAGLAQGSAFEIGLPPRADVMVDSRQHVRRVLSSLLEQFGRDQALTKDIESSIQDLLSLHEDLAWDIKGALVANVLELRGIESSSGRSLLRYPGAIESRRGLLEEAVARARDIVGVFDTLSPKYPPFVAKLTSFVAGPDLGVLGGTTLLGKSQFADLVKKKDQGKVTPEQEEAWRFFREILDRTAIVTASAEFEPHLRLMGHIEEGMQRTARRENIVYLDRLSATLRDFLADGGVPTAFLYWGGRIPHFFLDEFQDTSACQWQALFPLLEEALATGGSLFFVGDKKQAIYRFRGGSAQLFDAARTAFPYHLYDDSLPENHRSRKVLVDFYNRVFSRGSLLSWFDAHVRGKLPGCRDEDFEEHIARVFEGPEQESRTEGGYVRLETLAFPEEETLEAGLVSVIDRIATQVLPDLRQRGYRNEEIALLVRTNKEAALVSRVLTDRGFAVASEATLGLPASSLIMEIVAFLAFLDTPLDDLMFASFIGGAVFTTAAGIPADEIFRFLNERDRSTPAYAAFRSWNQDAWNDWIQPFFNVTGYLAPYDLVQSILRRFDVVKRYPSHEVFVYHLLEVIKEREAEGETALGALLEFWKEERDSPVMQVPLPEGAGGIRIQTIHKAKGLGFPVVILPFPYLLNPPREWGLVDVEEALCPVRFRSWVENVSPTLNRVKTTERMADLTDELCAFYVSVTRAAEELYVFLPGFTGRQWNRKRPVPIPSAVGDVQEHGLKRSRPPVSGARPAAPKHYRPVADWSLRLVVRRDDTRRLAAPADDPDPEATA